MTALDRDDPLADFEAREISCEGREARDAGFRVYMPSLFGRDGAVAEAEAGAKVFRRACMSAEFRAFGGGAPLFQSSSIASALRNLCNNEFGMDCARRVAWQQLSFRDLYRLTICASALQFVREGAWAELEARARPEGEAVGVEAGSAAIGSPRADA